MCKVAEGVGSKLPPYPITHRDSKMVNSKLTYSRAGVLLISEIVSQMTEKRAIYY